MAAVVVVVIFPTAPMAPQRPSRHGNTACAEVSPAWPFPARRHRQLPGSGEDLARHGDPGALLDGVLPGEHLGLWSWGTLAPQPPRLGSAFTEKAQSMWKGGQGFTE